MFLFFFIMEVFACYNRLMLYYTGKIIDDTPISHNIKALHHYDQYFATKTALTP